MLPRTKQANRASRKPLANELAETASRNPQPEPLVKTDDVARVLNVTPRYVGILCAEGRIPFHKFGRRCLRFQLSRVLEAMGIEGERGNK
jgi:excisionase family DNA binding protein